MYASGLSIAVVNQKIKIAILNHRATVQIALIFVNDPSADVIFYVVKNVDGEMMDSEEGDNRKIRYNMVMMIVSPPKEFDLGWGVDCEYCCELR